MGFVSRLQRELMEERGRVDALKQCLEMEREKSEFLAMSHRGGAEGGGGGDAAVPAAAAAAAAHPPCEDPTFKHEWVVFNQRR